MDSQSLFQPVHCAATLEVDPRGASLAGRVRLTGWHVRSARRVGLNFRGGVVHNVAVNGVEVSASGGRLLDPFAAVARVAPAEGGLELLGAALTAAAAEAAVGELGVDVPAALLLSPEDAAGAAAHVQLVVDVAFSVRGSSGALVFATAPSGAAGGGEHHYAYTRLRPGAGCAAGGLGLGARCVMPCADTPASRCKYDLTLTVAGADEHGAIAGSTGGEALRADVLGCGDFVRAAVVDGAPHPARGDSDGGRSAGEAGFAFVHVQKHWSGCNGRAGSVPHCQFGHVR